MVERANCAGVGERRDKGKDFQVSLARVEILLWVGGGAFSGCRSLQINDYR